MSNLSDEYQKIINDIENKISNESDKKFILNKFSELSNIYMDEIKRVEEKLNKVSETVNLIKKDIYEDNDYDFEIVCPYCNHEFVADVEDELKEEIECPECHNLINLDWNPEDDFAGGCTGMCSTCGFGDSCMDDFNDIDDDM